MAQQPNPTDSPSWVARFRQAFPPPSAILQHVSTPEPSECLGQPVTIPSDSEDLPGLPDHLSPFPPFFTPRSAYTLQAAVGAGAAAEKVHENVAAAGPVVEDDGEGAGALDNFAISASTASVVETEVVAPASEPQRETEAVPSTAAIPERNSGAVKKSAAAAGETSIISLVHEFPSISIPVASIHPELAGPADEILTPCWTITPASIESRTSKSRRKQASVEDAPEEQATFTPWENPVPLKQWLPINYKEPMLPGGILEEDILSIVDYMPHISPQTQAKFRWLSEWTVTMEPVPVPGPYNVVDIVIEVGRPMDILHQWRGRVLPDRRGPCLSLEIYKITNTVCEQTGNEILFWSSPCTENGPRSGLQVPLLPRTSRALRLAREQETAKSKDKENCEDGCEMRPKAPPKHKRCPLHGLPCCDDGYNEVIVPKVEGSWDTQEQVMKSLENLSRPDLMLAWAPKEDKDKDKETKVARELLAVPVGSPYVLRQEYDDALNKVLRREAHYPSPLHDVITSKQGGQRMAPTINATMAPSMRAIHHPTKSYREGFFRDPTDPPSSQILMHPKDMKRLDDYDREIYARQQEMKRPGWAWKPMDFSSISDIADEQAQGALESFLLTITRPEILVSRYMDELLHHWGTMNCEKQDDLLPHFVSHFSCRSHPTWRWNAYYHLIGAAIRRDLCQTIAAHDIRYLMTLNNGLAEVWVKLGASAPVEVLQRELAVISSTIAKAYIIYFVRDLMRTGVFLAAPKIRMHHILRGETKDYIQSNGSLFTDLDKMPTVKINRTTEKDVLNRRDLQYDWHNLPHPGEVFKIHALLSEVAETGEIADPRAFTKEIMDLSMLKITSHSLSPLIITVFDKIRLLSSLIDPELVRPASEIDACLENLRRYTGSLPGLYSVRALQDFSYESWRSVPKRLYQHIYLRLDEKAHDLLSWPPPLPMERDDSIEHELYQFGASLIRHLRDNFKIDVPFLKRDTLNPELEQREDGMLSLPVLDRRFAQALLDYLKEKKPDPATLPKMRIAIKDPPSPQEIWEHWKKRERKRVIYADFRKSSQHGLAKVTNDKADKFMKKRMASIEKARRRAAQARASTEARIKAREEAKRAVREAEARREKETKAEAGAKAKEQAVKSKKRQAKVTAGPSQSNGEQAEEASVAGGSYYQKPRVDDATYGDDAGLEEMARNRRRAASDATDDTDNTENTEGTEGTEATDVSEWEASQPQTPKDKQKLQAKKKQEADTRESKTTPEGLPKGRLQHKHWTRITTLLGEGSTAVTWKDVESAFRHVGYRISYHGGSSVKFTWTRKCMWASTAGIKPESLGSIMFHRPHHNKDIWPGLLHAMCERLGKRGMNLELLYQYYEMR